jgi:hypothetical protein
LIQTATATLSTYGILPGALKKSLKKLTEPCDDAIRYERMKKELTMTAKQFLIELSAFQTKDQLENVQRYFRDEGFETKFLDVRMTNIFLLAKKFTQMPLNEIGKLLESKFYEARMGAVSIMDFQARNKKATVERKKELFDLYISKHNFINNWDLVDRSAPYVVGGYLIDKPRKILYKLAKSKNVWERRSLLPIIS